ncbi:tyrosine-protein phosphatase [Nonomuraea diastatica]|uniref:tyrosine-protein phosphatase n=1 Tax=Nonomuraea diastatica TaxID=1848329 RepID=UPI003CCC6F60
MSRGGRAVRAAGAGSSGGRQAAVRCRVVRWRDGRERRGGVLHVSGTCGRALAWPGCQNVRDLGGLPVSGGGRIRRGAFIRADRPRPETVPALAELGETLPAIYEAILSRGARRCSRRSWRPSRTPRPGRWSCTAIRARTARGWWWRWP